MDYFDELSALFESEDAQLFEPKLKRHVAMPDERLIDSFGEITTFAREYGRLPNAGADDMKEAELGTSLNAIRTDKQKVDVLEEYDELGMLELEKAPESLEDLFAKDNGLFGSADIFDLSKLPESKRVVEHHDGSAKREVAEDFDTRYKYWFVEQQTKLANGERKLTPFYNIDQLQRGNFYVYDGMMCHVLELGEKERKAGGYSQQRMYVIFENGTQSNMYRRSLAQRLYEGGMVVVDASHNPEIDEAETTGHIYILKSLSEDPKITTVANLYKIGVTTDSVSNRTKHAVTDPTYLMAPVGIVEDYRLTGEYNPQKVEDLIHQIFGHAKVDLQIIASDSTIYTPQEWYSVPLNLIVEAIDLIATGEIVNYHYDSATQSMVENEF
jgi:hypothetical protein